MGPGASSRMMVEGAIDPAKVPSLGAEQVHELLDRWFASHPARAVAEVPHVEGVSALAFGDTHTDWPTVEHLAVRGLRADGGRGWIIATGDYVDRAPPELRFGSAINALYLLSLQLAAPGRVVLLRGNHETQRAIPVLRREVDDEANALWGRESGVADRIEDAFDRWPLAATSESGAYWAHAGFPRRKGTDTGDWRSALDPCSVTTLEEVVWNDLEVSSYAGGRGLDIPPITESETLKFLDEAGLSIFLRGHDPSEAGRARFQDRVLTLHTSRIYDWAGLHIARVPLGRRLRTVHDLERETLTPPAIPPTSDVRERARA